MSKTTKLLEELAEIGKEAVKYGYSDNGVNWVYVTPNIRAYTSENLDHTASDIFGISIDYFRPVKFDFTIQQLEKLPTIVTDARAELDEYIKEYEARDADEAERKKQERKESLLRQLAEIESSPQ